MASVEHEAKVGAYWDERSRASGPTKTRWWESLTVRRYLNRLVCNQDCEGPSEGLVRRLAQTLDQRGIPRPLSRAVSVGGGHGQKEGLLLEAGIVQQVVVYELSEARIEEGRRRAQERGYGDRLQFERADALRVCGPESFDLVHWNNALHHMLDVDAAVQWSRRVLRPGGVFYMDDFVGPDRFQWSDAALRIASDVRASLPTRFLQDPRDPARRIRIRVPRPDRAGLIASDPSEAAQSSRILGAVRTYFPDVDLVPTGGVVYHLALSDVLANFDEEDEADRALLESLLEFDRTLTLWPQLETHYAVALAFKEDETPVLSKLRWKAHIKAQDALPSGDALRTAWRKAVPESLRRKIWKARR